jgi:hypothetical protein
MVFMRSTTSILFTILVILAPSTTGKVMFEKISASDTRILFEYVEEKKE